MRPAYEWDHIDPNYPEGCDRPYQMVCGFTNELNLIERDRSLNSRKSNRFLPWRVAKDEVGSIPVNPGDLCQFLDRATGEWVLEEFMGEWWFEQTRDLCGEHFSGIKNRDNKTGIFNPEFREDFLEMQRLTKTGIYAEGVASLGGKAVFQKRVGLGALTKGQLSEQGSLPWWHNPMTTETKRSETSPGYGWEPGRGPLPSSKPYENVNVDKYICLQTGYISTAAGVAAWQKKREIPPSKRVKLTPEEAAFIFLWAL